MSKQKNKVGFTLIETIIYVALFGLIIFVAVISAYNLMEGSKKNNTAIGIEQESLFISQKFNWLLNSSTNVFVTNFGKTLTIVRQDLGTSSPVVIKYYNQDLMLSRGTSPSNSLISERYKITDFFTEYDTSLKFISIKYKIDNKDFSYKKYINN